jgi:predicted ATP-grasp superfamily ATP-dependent carboligase
VDAVANKIQFQVNRNVDQDQVLESVELLKEQIEKTREMVSLEGDNFEQQFVNR